MEGNCRQFNSVVHEADLYQWLWYLATYFGACAMLHLDIFSFLST